jgi:Domain of unknown function (DUF397)
VAKSDPTPTVWRKSTASGSSDCVEVAFAGEAVLVRCSRDRSGPILRFLPHEWTAFLAGVRNGEFDPDPLNP